MSELPSNETTDPQGTAELEQALITVELRLDETFEAAEQRAATSDEGAGLILEHVLDLIYDTFSPVIPYDRVGVAIVEDEGELVHSRWARAEADSLTMGSGYAAPVSEEAVRAILAGGKALIVNDLETYLREHPDSQPTRDIVDEGMRSCLIYPLTAADKPIGMMVFSSRQPDTYTGAHETAFGRVAAHVAAILDRSRLYERLADLNWQLRVARDALQYQATHDSLTGLWNRSAITDKAEQEMDRARRQRRPVAIVMCDIDHFKAINDEHGHVVGDTVLRAVAERLEGALRSYEEVGRYGGEEFLVTLYDCDVEAAASAMERLRLAVGAEPIDTRKGQVSLSISLGAAVSPEANADLDDLVRTADEALYAAKDAGRNCHRVRRVEASSS